MAHMVGTMGSFSVGSTQLRNCSGRADHSHYSIICSLACNSKLHTDNEKVANGPNVAAVGNSLSMQDQSVLSIDLPTKGAVQFLE